MIQRQDDSDAVEELNIEECDGKIEKEGHDDAEYDEEYDKSYWMPKA